MTKLVKTTSPEEEELRRKKEGLPHGTGMVQVLKAIRSDSILLC